MPQNLSMNVTQSWTLLTDANVTEVTFQNIGGSPIFIHGTNGATPVPSDTLEGIRYEERQGELKTPLADLFPGVSGVNRLWARGVRGGGRVFVSHA